ncbi:hypothetical protein ACFY9F_05670 [Streptomyces sp. NPDC012421]|uniref:hypothetical protein n=1 Tax=Streptomyces sp. NPDC012421 TaxID=3364832 RepID=UPI0036E82C55
MTVAGVTLAVIAAVLEPRGLRSTVKDIRRSLRRVCCVCSPARSGREVRRRMIRLAE